MSKNLEPSVKEYLKSEYAMTDEDIDSLDDDDLQYLMTTGELPGQEGPEGTPPDEGKLDDDNWDEDEAGVDPPLLIKPITGGQGALFGGGPVHQSWQSGGKTTMKFCDHYGAKEVYTTMLNDVQLFGANNHGLNFWKSQIILDCGDVTPTGKPNFVVSAPERYKTLNRHVVAPQVIKLGWKDFGVPPVGFAFWKETLSLFPKKSKVTVCCQGGHGRTGTALSCLMVADGWEGRDAILYVREHHCRKAVETKDQVDYIMALSDAAAAAAPKKKKKKT